MAKAQIKISNDVTEAKKLVVSARISKVKLGLRTVIPGDQSLLEVDYRDPADLFEMGKLFQSVVGNELDAQLAKEAEAAAKKAAAQAANVEAPAKAKK